MLTAGHLNRRHDIHWCSFFLSTDELKSTVSFVHWQLM